MIDDYSYNLPKNQVKRDYQQKEFNNPYFGEQKHKKQFPTLKYLKILGFILILYIIIYSDLFRVKTIEIIGTDLIPKNEMEGLIKEKISGGYLFIIPKNNLLYLSKKSIAKTVNEKYVLNKFEIKKRWQKLYIKIEEKTSYLIINDLSNKNYFCDQEGTVTREISPEDFIKYSSKTPIYETSASSTTIGEKIVRGSIVQFILELDKNIKDRALPKVKNYESRGVDQLIIGFEEGWQAKLDINSSSTNSLDNLKIILDKKVPDRRKLEYIDISFGDMGYIKMR